MFVNLNISIDPETLRQLHEQLNEMEEKKDSGMKDLPRDDFADAMRAGKNQHEPLPVQREKSPIPEELRQSYQETMMRRRLVGGCPACGQN